MATVLIQREINSRNTHPNMTLIWVSGMRVERCGGRHFLTSALTFFVRVRSRHGFSHGGQIRKECFQSFSDNSTPWWGRTWQQINQSLVESWILSFATLNTFTLSFPAHRQTADTHETCRNPEDNTWATNLLREFYIYAYICTLVPQVCMSC